jgi:hypothetical protein
MQYLYDETDDAPTLVYPKVGSTITGNNALSKKFCGIVTDKMPVSVFTFNSPHTSIPLLSYILGL